MSLRKAIYAPSASLDAEADEAIARATQLRVDAHAMRWLQAPTWANCIAAPTKSALQAIKWRAELRKRFPDWGTHSEPPEHGPLGEDDWRWANRDNYEWFFFDAEGTARSSAESGTWTIKEWRPPAAELNTMLAAVVSALDAR